ncbi:MAG: aspartate aminotransferase family protein [Candidatus Omnitrophica bacterium]|nr:aspartate aminotransferase family protein [Candidatus Omnitrophota bacterium]
MKKEEIFNFYNKYILGTYFKLPVIFVKGKGSYLWDIDGKKYLDFFPGWGVVSLGHCHPKVMSAIRNQVSKLIFVSNNYYHSFQAKLAKELNFFGFDSKVFFCNSGAEANEAAIKFCRKFGKTRYKIITFKNSFHGRTLACLAATGQEKYREGFLPLPEGFKTAIFNDLKSVEELIDKETIAVMLELIQGEGGVNVAKEEFVLGLRKLCDEKDLLLVIDEVQTGIGRTGKMFCYQHYNIQPDIITLAKGIAGGLPLAAMMVREDIADVMKPGSHASTFGGGPIVCSAALAVLKTIQKDKLLTHVIRMGDYIFKKLAELKSKYSIIKEVRGKGLMWGIELNIPATKIVESALERGLLINCTQDYVLRIMPALNISKKDIDKGLKILENVLKYG